MATTYPTWDDLAEIRAQGMRPALPVVITTDGKRPAWLLASEGCLVIRHEPGSQFHVELLDGLDVWLFLGDCGRAQAVIRAMNAKGVQPAQLRAWCPCSQQFDTAPAPCAVAQEWAA